MQKSPKKKADQDESNEGREEWEKSQRSSGLIEKNDDLWLDNQRHLYKVMKDKFTGRVHQDFTKKARNLNDGSRKTYADNVGVYAQKIKYTIQPRTDDQQAHNSFEHKNLANKVKKTRTE